MVSGKKKKDHLLTLCQICYPSSSLVDVTENGIVVVVVGVHLHTIIVIITTDFSFTTHRWAFLNVTGEKEKVFKDFLQVHFLQPSSHHHLYSCTLANLTALALSIDGCQEVPVQVPNQSVKRGASSSSSSWWFAVSCCNDTQSERVYPHGDVSSSRRSQLTSTMYFVKNCLHHHHPSLDSIWMICEVCADCPLCFTSDYYRMYKHDSSFRTIAI